MSQAVSFTGKRWLVHEEKKRNVSIVEHLAARRGIHLGEAASWEKLSDPLLLGEMPAAVERIQRAMEKREQIGIIGDYDADGITGVAQLVRFFRRKKIEPHIILPHRERHGYGVKKEFIDALRAKGVTLLLTVDTGIGAVEEITYARSLGMDTIVCDHHEPRASLGLRPEPQAELGGSGFTAGHAPANELPNAIIVHPSYNLQPTTCYLSGSGVVFTLLRALESDFTAAKHSEAGWEERDTDVALAAVGTVGDVVSLLQENRTIVALGLEAMNAVVSRGATGTLCDPLFCLAKSVIKDGEQLKSSHLAFRIAPRINAAGRIADPSLSLKVLLEGGPYIQQLHTLNQRRQLMTEKMMEIALEHIDLETPVLACASSLLHVGIIGLLASKLTSRYGRPSIVGHERDDGLLTCSLRSVPSYNILAALQRCAGHLSSFGGHEAAAGCTLEQSCWRAFIHALSSDAASVLGEEPRIPTLRIDAALNSQDISPSLVRELEVLEPFGAGNPEPLFLLRHQKLSCLRLVGRDEKHLQCFMNGVKAIGFGLGEHLTALPAEADCVCHLGIDRWNGREQVQLFIEDIAESVLVASTH